ncbi:MAG: hypothetical protein MZU91_10365 [Desulfosudis oleivorans]|nr:hypothetical protein [Desulfosudis oleivorans]
MTKAPHLVLSGNRDSGPGADQGFDYYAPRLLGRLCFCAISRGTGEWYPYSRGARLRYSVRFKHLIRVSLVFRGSVSDVGGPTANMCTVYVRAEEASITARNADSVKLSVSRSVCGHPDAARQDHGPAALLRKIQANQR